MSGLGSKWTYESLIKPLPEVIGACCVGRLNAKREGCADDHRETSCPKPTSPSRTIGWLLDIAFVGGLTGLCGEVSTPGKVMHIYVLTNREAARRLICRRNDTHLGDCAMLRP